MNKKLQLTSSRLMRELILSFALLACISVFAGVRASFMVSPDTIKIPSDTIGTDTTLVRINGQQGPFLSPSIPSSPQAEAFQRVGDYTVNNASGMPDISIPLYEIDHHGYKIPIALRYIATPLKPGYNYDVTGHGWTLTLGSCISRTITSQPDENSNFKVREDVLYYYYNNRPDGINEELKQYNWQSCPTEGLSIFTSGVTTTTPLPSVYLTIGSKISVLLPTGIWMTVSSCTTKMVSNTPLTQQTIQ